MIKILHIEDERNSAEHVKELLEHEFTIHGVTITRICTESEFRKALDSIAKCPPTLVLMDIMLRWCDPSADFEEPPQDVKEGGYERAGFRCQKLLWEKNQNIPVLFYTVLDKSGLQSELRQMPQNVICLSKGEDVHELTDIIREISASSLGVVT